MSNETDVLQYALSHDIINLEEIREKMREEQRTYYLNMHKYSIFQDSRGLWRTTIPDMSKKSGRRMIARKSRKALEDELVLYYTTNANVNNQEISIGAINNDITFEKLYPIWMKSRISEVESINTAKRNNQDWEKYYKIHILSSIKAHTRE